MVRETCFCGATLEAHHSGAMAASWEQAAAEAFRRDHAACRKAWALRAAAPAPAPAPVETGDGAEWRVLDAGGFGRTLRGEDAARRMFERLCETRGTEGPFTLERRTVGPWELVERQPSPVDDTREGGGGAS